jgi:transcriptional regulator with XRE-family HTH domain
MKINKKTKTEIELFVINKVKEKRLEKGYSQAELADLIHLSAGFIGKVESSNHLAKYNLNHINLFAKIFNCSPQELLPNHYLKENDSKKTD